MVFESEVKFEDKKVNGLSRKNIFQALGTDSTPDVPKNRPVSGKIVSHNVHG